MTGKTDNLHPDLVDVLTKLEMYMGFELYITSGHRSQEHNDAVGGVKLSEHKLMPSMAADVLCKRSSTRYRMLKELFLMGVRRIGVGDSFIHVGVSKDHPQDVCWDYYPENSEGG